MMTLGRVAAVASVLLIATAAPSQARPRIPGLLFAPLAIVGGIAGAAIASRKARAHRAYQYRHKVRRDRGAVVRSARPAAPEPERIVAAPTAPAVAAAALPSAAWVGPLFWPHAYDGVFKYTFGAADDDNRFWTRGFADVVDAMFAPPVRETSGSGTSRSWEDLCGAATPQAADVTIARIRELVQPSEAQQPALDGLRAALMRATERIEGACPARRAATPTDRLYTMVARLTAMRQAVLTVQAPLRAFYDQLNEQQKAALDGAGAADGLNCAPPVADWPQAQLERALRPTQAQRAGLERLRQTSLGLAQFVAATCPAAAPRTAPERLEAVKERLAVLRYAATSVVPAYEQFYGSLSDAQKARFQAIARERRAETSR